MLEPATNDIKNRMDWQEEKGAFPFINVFWSK